MITSIIQGGRSQGMQLMDDALMALVEAKRITPREAYMKAANKTRFEEMIEGEA
jgi:twitching motility protein PilT